MNKALGTNDNGDLEDECDMAGCMDQSCFFCDVKIEEKEDVTNYIERCDDDAN